MDDTQRKDVLIAVRLPTETRDRFKAYAAQQHRSVSQELRRLIELQLEHATDLKEAA